MKTGFSVFLAAFVALGASWFGLVYAPLEQLGGAKQTVILQTSDTWPLQRTGDATLGLQVYRAAGCAACHTEQVRQTSVANTLILTSLGGHPPGDFKEFLKSYLILPALNNYSNSILDNLEKWDGSVPVTLYAGDDAAVVSTLTEKLKVAGIKTSSGLVAGGVDIARGWGVRQSVAADYLYDEPIQLGNLRAGPDLMLAGVRSPDVNTQLLHLYAPRAVLKSSTMPPFRFLFETRKAGSTPSPDALVLPKEFSPGPYLEVVPTADARHLAAYLVSLKASVPLYEAPFTPVTAAK